MIPFKKNEDGEWIARGEKGIVEWEAKITKLNNRNHYFGILFMRIPGGSVVGDTTIILRSNSSDLEALKNVLESGLEPIDFGENQK